MRKTASAFMLWTLTSVMASFGASATVIDFDTDASGTPYSGIGDSFHASEYAPLGVQINDSDPASGITFVNLINPVNVGTDISGYHVNVGAFAGISSIGTISGVLARSDKCGSVKSEPMRE